jgi:uncharacterized protein
MTDTSSSGMIMRSAAGLLALLLFPLPVDAQQRPPIIDMHLHAMAAARQGPPPLPMCTPVPAFPAWDPAIPYGAMLAEMMKSPPCADPVWSPRTDAEVMQQTIAAMRRRNVFGVLTGSPGRVAAWREAAPDLFIPALEFSPATHANITPDSIRRLVERRAVAVLGEVENQYDGIAPDVIERSIEVIEEAPFLSEEQKRDILYNNAARFLRLSAEEIARHHGRR